MILLYFIRSFIVDLDWYDQTQSLFRYRPLAMKKGLPYFQELMKLQE